MNGILHKQLPPQKPVIGALSSHEKQALFYGSGREEILQQPEIIFINADGIMLRGYEPNGVTKSGRMKFVYQEWFVRFVQNDTKGK